MERVAARARAGKLRRAAVVWAYASTGRSDPGAPAELDDAVRAQFAAMNATVREEAEAAEPRHFAVMEENWPALLLFLSLETQWQVHIGPKRDVVWLGLNYTAAESLMRVEKVKDKARHMRELRAMEAAALRVLNGGSAAEGDEPWL